MVGNQHAVSAVAVNVVQAVVTPGLKLLVPAFKHRGNTGRLHLAAVFKNVTARKQNRAAGKKTTQKAQHEACMGPGCYRYWGRPVLR